MIWVFWWIKKKNLDFIAKFGNALQSLHYPFIDLAKKSWINTDIINYVQGIISTNSIGDIWLDTFTLTPIKPSNKKSTDEIVPLKYKLIISGRYLVRPIMEDEEQNLRDTLIELDRLKKESLTEYLAKIPHIDKIERKTFLPKEKGIFLIASFLISNTKYHYQSNEVFLKTILSFFSDYSFLYYLILYRAFLFITRLF